MEFKNLVLRKQDSVMWILVNRPAKLNALNQETIRELGEAVEAAAKDSAVDALVLSGAGEKAFVAGADIAELVDLSPAAAQAYAEHGQAVLHEIARSAKPVVAAVNGYALGGGCELAMACHLRVASETAVFGQPEVKLGLIPGFGGTQRLPRLVGKGRALEILLTGRNVSAKQALEIGLVCKVVPPAALAQEVTSTLKEILCNGPQAVARVIAAVENGLDLDLQQACKLEAALFGLGAGSDEMVEGTTAFLQKRKATFR